MKGDAMLKVLSIAGEAAVTVAEVVATIMAAPYGASADMLEKTHRDMFRDREDRRRRALEKQRCYNVIWRLRRDGLLEGAGRGRVKITGAGKEAIETLRSKNNARATAPDKNDGQASFDGATVVAFDVPEEKRRARALLRAALKDMGFRMVQKSMWMGTAALPEKFLRDLEAWDIAAHVQLFRVERAGTLGALPLTSSDGRQ